MPSVKVNFRSILYSGNVNGFVNYELNGYYNKFTSKGSDYLQSTNDTTLTNDIINSTFWFKIKPLNGYKIIRAYHGYSSGSVAKEITDFENEIYLNVSGNMTVRQDYIFIECEENSGEFNFVQDLTNCTSSDNQTTINSGEQTIILTANNGYFFEEEPTCNMCVITLNEDRTIATIVMNVTGDTYLKGYAIVKTRYYNLTQTLINCTSDKQDKIAEGKQTITFTANDGYEFKNYGDIKVGVISSSISDFSDDLKYAYANIYNVNGDVTLSLSASKHTEQIGKFVNLYNTNDIELNRLSEVRFYNVGGGSTEIVDYGSFIYNLMSLPFEIPSDMLIDEATIQLGNYDSNVASTLIKGHLLNINIGNIFVDEKYHNVYDYINTECYLHLPFIEKMLMNVEYVINHTITINYVIDLYTGKSTVNIISDFTGKVVASKPFDIGYKIPFISEQNNTLVSELQTMVDNDIRTAFIEVVRNIPYDVNTPFGKDTIDYGKLEDYEGYIEVNNIILNVTATNAEKSEIEMLLKQGVFIRK